MAGRGPNVTPEMTPLVVSVVVAARMLCIDPDVLRRWAREGIVTPHPLCSTPQRMRFAVAELQRVALLGMAETEPLRVVEGGAA
jgi:hypothetical protein